MSNSFYFDPEASGLEVFLGPMETRLMELAWKYGELTVKKALFYLGPDSRPAYTTVMTVLSRLADKGIMVRVKGGRNYVYRPALERNAFLADRLGRVRECLSTNFDKES